MNITSEYIERRALLEKAKELAGGSFSTPLIISAIEYAPAVDVVSREVFEQVKWERDTALQTLQEHGIGLGETADVVEVKHGEWHLLYNCANEGVYCSVCHKKVYKTDYANQKIKSPFCPNCGAKMDGKEGAEE